MSAFGIRAMLPGTIAPVAGITAATGQQPSDLREVSLVASTRQELHAYDIADRDFQAEQFVDPITTMDPVSRRDPTQAAVSTRITRRASAADSSANMLTRNGRAPIGQNGYVSNVFSLDRPVYGIAQAAHLLGLRPGRTRAWLDGYTRSGTRYPPVVREATTRSDLVTWGEFVELGYLREYRQADVALQRIRPVIARLRREYDSPYPLAHHRPWVYDKELVLEAQEAEGLPTSLAIVVRTGQEIMLSDVAKSFIRRVEFDANTARRWRPQGEYSPVIVDPSVAFGMPTVDGISTERLYELVVAGESLAEVADGYGISVDLLRNACAYEEMARRLAA